MQQSKPLRREELKDVRKWEEHASDEMARSTSLFLSLAVSHLKDVPRVPLKPRCPPSAPPPSGDADGAATRAPPDP
jgi:hypothetical protein